MADLLKQARLAEAGKSAPPATTTTDGFVNA
jgi:hypothetical protein